MGIVDPSDFAFVIDVLCRISSGPMEIQIRVEMSLIKCVFISCHFHCIGSHRRLVPFAEREIEEAPQEPFHPGIFFFSGPSDKVQSIGCRGEGFELS